MILNRHMTPLAVASVLMVTLLSFGPVNQANAADGTADNPQQISKTMTAPGGNTFTLTGCTPAGGNLETDPVIGSTNVPGGTTVTVKYTPDIGFSGTIIVACDFKRNTGNGNGKTTTVTATIIIAPTLSENDDAQATVIDYVGTVTDISGIFDILGSSDPYIYICHADHGSVTSALEYTPVYSYDTDTVTCHVTDKFGTPSNEVTVAVDIQQWWTVRFIDRLSPGTPILNQYQDQAVVNFDPGVPTEAGYTFDGWFLNEACTIPTSEYESPMTVASQMDYVACWTADSSQIVPTNSGSNVSGGSQNSPSEPNGYGGPYTDPRPGVPWSQVHSVCSTSSLTGGCAALADGQDTKWLQVTLGHNQTGSTAGFSITYSPAGVQLASVTRNSDGSFMLALTSTTPGIYQVTVRYNGVVIGTVTVNFIAGTASLPSATVGSSQVLTGYGFMPGELVTISVHSDPIQVARLAADASGMVQATFVIPKGFALGAHTAILAGDRSGTATAAFTVGTMVSTGGSVSSTGSAGLVGLLVMAGLAAVALIWRRRISLAG